MTHVIIWEFQVLVGHEREFEETYGPRGAWATLFSKSADYLGTELLRDKMNPRRYLTLDRWTNIEAFKRFRETQATAYEALDVRCAAWTEKEAKLGTWTVTT